jgi:DNA-binding PadR family transcriptional regulator
VYDFDVSKASAQPMTASSHGAGSARGAVPVSTADKQAERGTATRFAVLGIVRDGPAYQYQIANRLKELLGPSWAINSGQVSQIAKRLVHGGLIEEVERPDSESGERSTDRQLYRITAQGNAAWLLWHETKTTIGELQLSRKPLLAKIALGGPHGLEDVLGQIDWYEEDVLRRLNDLRRARDEIVDGTQVRADFAVLRLALWGDIFQLQGELQWARTAREVVHELRDGEAIWPPNVPRRDGEPDAPEKERKDAKKELFGRMAARDRPKGT